MIGVLVNQKGGVAKTTNTVHIGACLAQKGFKVLLIDFDSQCDLTHSVGIKNADYTVVDFLEGKSNFRLKQKSENFFILPGDDYFISNKYKKNILKEKLYQKTSNGSSLNDFFDYIFIDCPPSKIILSDKKYNNSEIEIALYSSDFFIIPLKADDFSVKNANKFLGKVASFISSNNLDIKFLGFFFGCILVTENSKEYYTRIFEKNNITLLFDAFIRQDSEVKKAVQKGLTIFQHNPNCRASLDFENLTNEFLKKLNND